MTGPARVHRYGAGPDRFLELILPSATGDGAGRAPVAVVLHGGFWRPAYGIELARPLAADLAGAGYAAVAVEYRRVGQGGGWPGTLEDVAAALDCLAGLPEAPGMDLTDVTAVGHSAGGQLAAWLAGRDRLPQGAPGGMPRIRVTAAVLQAGVLDLTAADRRKLGGGAVRAFLGGSAAAVPARYAAADPVGLLPTGARVLCVHGSSDDVVPVEQSERYATAAARAGDRVELRVVPGDHMALIDPSSGGWTTVREWLAHGRAPAPYA